MPALRSRPDPGHLCPSPDHLGQDWSYAEELLPSSDWSTAPRPVLDLILDESDLQLQSAFPHPERACGSASSRAATFAS